MVKKNLKICLFVLRECTDVTDGQTGGQTPHHGMSRKHRAAKKQTLNGHVNYSFISFVVIVQ